LPGGLRRPDVRTHRYGAAAHVAGRALQATRHSYDLGGGHAGGPGAPARRPLGAITNKLTPPPRVHVRVCVVYCCSGSRACAQSDNIRAAREDLKGYCSQPVLQSMGVWVLAKK